MCQILFSAIDKGSDNIKGHRRGDPLAIKSNSHVWGHGEDKRVHLAKFGNLDAWEGRFVVIKITDLTIEKAKEYLATHTRPANMLEPEFNAPDEADRVVQLSRKGWGLFIDELPNPFKDKLIDDGYAAINIAQINLYFRHKGNGALISG